MVLAVVLLFATRTIAEFESDLRQSYTEEVRRQLQGFHPNAPQVEGTKSAPLIRGDSYPFVTGDGFRAACSVVFEEQDSYNITDFKSMRAHSCVFVKTDLIDEFFRDIRPHIVVPFVLVTHNSDFSAPTQLPLLSAKKQYDESSRLDNDELLVRWYAQNCFWEGYPAKSRPKKLACIPIGLENRYNKFGSRLQVYRLMMQRRIALRQTPKLLLVAFSRTYPDRVKALNALSGQPFVTEGNFDWQEYLTQLTEHRFAAVPFAHGLDSHRLWESLLCGCIPVMRNSSLASLFAGLPVLLIDDWRDVTQAFLDEAYERIKAGGSMDFLILSAGES